MARGDWYYNSINGKVAQDGIIPVPFPASFGWHGPFKTKQEALDFAKKGAETNPGWQTPTESNVQALENTPNAAVSKLGLSNEQIGSWLVRIGEIVLGIVLVGVGLAKLTGTTNAVAGLVKAKI